ncbi:MAG TPA: glycoside hydrolase family 18 [Puia sp.]
MKQNLQLSFLTLFILLALVHCKKQTTAEALTLQKPDTYSDAYYANLRAFKKTDHPLSYGWFSEYSQNYSYGQHFMGVPDSIDIISLWGGIPSDKMDDTTASYNPTAYTEMRFVQKTKGTKMLAVAIVRMQGVSWVTLDSAGIVKFAQYYVDEVLNHDLDGFDCDYEPAGDFLTGSNFTIFVKYMAQFLGPTSKNPDKLLVIDYYTTIPPAETAPLVNYFVNQAYTQGVTTSSATFLQGRYNSVASFLPVRKFIVTENMGDWWATGGAPFTEANGNTLDQDGNQLMSLQGMERWQPTQGPKAGWGAFYFERDYNLTPPYKYMRTCLQEANPAIQ